MILFIEGASQCCEQGACVLMSRHESCTKKGWGGGGHRSEGQRACGLENVLVHESSGIRLARRCCAQSTWKRPLRLLSVARSQMPPASGRFQWPPRIHFVCTTNPPFHLRVRVRRGCP